MKNDIDIKKLEELKDNYKNKNLLTIGLNDSQVVNTTSSF